MARGRRRKRNIVKGTFAEVVRAYMMSPGFEGLAKATRTSYSRVLRLAELPESLGAIPADEMRPALVQAFLDGLADRPAAQEKAQSVIKSLDRWAVVRDLLPESITFGTEVPGSHGGHTPWTDEQVTFAEQNARPYLSKIITLAANTGQRNSDLIRMRWSDIEVLDGRPGINVTQKKTGLELWVPFTSILQEALATWERRPGHILLKPDGRPFVNPQHVADLWIREQRREAMEPLRDAGLVMHGLRATAVVRLRRAGATIPQITDMVGMSAPMVTRYCRHSAQKENALAAVHVLDRRTATFPRENTAEQPVNKGGKYPSKTPT